LQQAGYITSVVGKWHLGLGDGNVDWNKPIYDCPIDIGFTSSFIMAATGDRVPCVYVRDRLVVGLDPADPITVSYGQPIAGEPTGSANPELLKMHPSHGHNQAIVNGISRIGYMKGGKSALWTDENMADDFTGEAIRFIEQTKDKPFFLFFALHDPHVPRVPHPRFVGKSQLGPRGDAIVQADWCVGQITATLERLGLLHNTLVIISSDNGPVLDDGYKDQAKELNGDHAPAGQYRGGKYSRYEGGTRVPFITCWPNRIKPGESAALVSQIDLYASLATLVGGTLAPSDAPDSLDVLPALLGTSRHGRDHHIEQGNGLAIRMGNWKYLPPVKGEKINKNTGTELGSSETGVLYDLEQDIGEKNNLANQHPEKVAELQEKLEAIQAAGRSR
jgi:arylsulfatase A-like enzyme